MKLIKLEINMAEFNFYINEKERAELISYILSKGTKIVPDAMYSTEEYLILNSIEDYFHAMNIGECKFFLLDNIYTKEPILNSRNRFSEKPIYSIEQRKGGPYIDLFFFLGHSSDAIFPYKRSWLSYYDRFIHYNSYEEFKVPESLKVYFRDLVRFIKTICRSVKRSGKTFWVSEEVLEEISSFS